MMEISPATYPKTPKREGLGPNQLAWLEEKFRFFGIHRAQAEAPTGVAVVQSPGAPKAAQQ